jgi:hypothetical protein
MTGTTEGSISDPALPTGQAQHESRKILGAVVACLIADGGTFVSRPVDALTLDFTGIPGDYHAGATRKSGSREPWYSRGTEIRNDRQLTIVSVEELTEVAARMAIAEIAPGWIGANLALIGVPDLTLLPAGTRFFFSGGATVVAEGENMPCRVAGRSIGEHAPGREGFDLLFPKVGRGKRGLVASVERPGIIRAGETVTVRLPRTR